MPKIPEYNRQFTYESPQVPGPRLKGFDVKTTAAQFGGESGRQLEKAGYLIQRGAAQAGQLYDDYNTTKAYDASRQMQESFLAWQSEAQKKQGEAGMSTGTDYDDWAKQQTETLTKGMNEIQRGRFEDLAGRQMAAQRHWAEGYGQQQEQTYKQATWQAQISVGSDSLAVNIHDPGLAEQALEQIKDAAFSMGQNSGIGEKATMELMHKSVSGALIPAIHAKIQAGETGTAAALMKQYSSQIGGAGLSKLDVELKRERERLQAKWEADKERANIRQASEMGASLFNDFGSDTASVMTKLDGISDVVQKSRVAQAYMGLARIDEVMKDRVKMEQREQLRTWAERELSKPDITPARASEVILSVEPEDQSRLHAMANKRFSGANFFTDGDRFDEARGEVIDGSVNAKNWAEFENRFSPYIADKDMGRFKEHVLQQERKGYERGVEMRFMDEAINRWSYDPKIAKDDYKKFSQELFELGITDTKGIEKHLEKWWTRNPMEKKYLWGAMTRTRTVPGHAVADMEQEGWRVAAQKPQNIPADTVLLIENHIREKLGKKYVTPENVRKIYEQNKDKL